MSFISPVYNIKRIPVDKIEQNTYNPNHVATPEMKLLYDSIKEDGYTMPIVCYYDEEKDKYIIVDGFHRYQIIKLHKDIYEREQGCLPVSIIDKDLSERMASTIRHNRARGEHNVDLMADILSELHKLGRSDNWIMKHLGMSQDEVLRLKQFSGLAELFKNHQFSESQEKFDHKITMKNKRPRIVIDNSNKDSKDSSHKDDSHKDNSIDN